MTVSNSAMEEASIHSFSVLGQQDNGEDNEGVYDLTSSIGREEYLQAVLTVRITRRSLEGGQFRHPLDGTRHNWIPAKKEDHCQWCYYHLMNVVSDKDRGHFTKSLRQNRSRVQQCLVCHVNLCPQCENSFHGSDLSTFSRV